MAMTWEDLAGVLERDVRTIHRWRKLKGAPLLPEVSAWREWLGAQPSSVTNVPSDAALPGDCSYDDLVKKGAITYALAKVREQVISEQVTNEAKRVELEKARGALVTRAEADKAMALVRDETVNRYDRAVARTLATLPVELRDAAQKAYEAFLDEG